MTVLIFIDWYLPGYKSGGPVRSMANLVDHLSHEMQFKIITRNTDYKDSQPYEDIQPGQWTPLKDNVSCCYLSEEQTNYKTIKKIVLDNPNAIIYINGIYSLKFSIFPLFIARKYHKGKIIVSTRGMLAESAINIKKTKKLFFIKLANTISLFKNIQFHATNQDEALQIKKHFSHDANVRIAPNLPGKILLWDSSINTAGLKKKGYLKMISLARISPEKNTLFALQTLNHHFKGIIEFELFGTIHDEDYWQKCQHVIKKLPHNISVHHKGTLAPDHLADQLRQNQFLFMPTKGENFGHAILESFMAGLPVIISDQTPWKNLQSLGIGWDLPLNDTKAFQFTLQKCLDMDHIAYSEMQTKTLEYAKKVSSNPKTIEQTRNLFVKKD